MAGKTNRKHGRNERWCQAYRSSARREQNKARRLIKHLKRQPGDSCARKAFDVTIAVLPLHLGKALAAACPPRQMQAA